MLVSKRFSGQNAAKVRSVGENLECIRLSEVSSRHGRGSDNVDKYSIVVIIMTLDETKEQRQKQGGRELLTLSYRALSGIGRMGEQIHWIL